MVSERDCCMECVVYRLLRNLERFSGSFFPNGEILFLFFTEELERLSGAGLWVACGWPGPGLRASLLSWEILCWGDPPDWAGPVGAGPCLPGLVLAGTSLD